MPNYGPRGGLGPHGDKQPGNRVPMQRFPYMDSGAVPPPPKPPTGGGGKPGDGCAWSAITGALYAAGLTAYAYGPIAEVLT